MPSSEPPGWLKHQALVDAIARHLTSQAADAEDLAQATWLKAVERPPAHDQRLRGWLARVTRTTAYDGARRRSREARHLPQRAAPEAPPTPAEHAEAGEMRERVALALRELDAKYWEVLWLRYHRGLPPREVAAKLGVPVETVRTRTRRGLALLRVGVEASSKPRSAGPGARKRGVFFLPATWGVSPALAYGLLALVMLGGAWWATSALRADAEMTTHTAEHSGRGDALGPALRGASEDTTPQETAESGARVFTSVADLSAATPDGESKVLGRGPEWRSGLLVSSAGGDATPTIAALVYPVRSDDRSGVLQPGLPSVKAHGMWQLRMADWSGWDLMIVDAWRRPLRISGDRLLEGEPLRIELGGRMPELTVHVVSAPTGIPTFGVAVDMVSEGQALGRKAMLAAVTGQRVQVPIPYLGAYRVRFKTLMPRFTTVPAYVDLEGSGHVIEVRVVRTVPLNLTILSAEDDAPFAGLDSVQLESLDEEGAAIRSIWASWSDPKVEHVFAARMGLPPGNHRLRVHALGFGPYELRVAVPEGATVAEATLRVNAEGPANVVVGASIPGEADDLRMLNFALRSTTAPGATWDRRTAFRARETGLWRMRDVAPGTYDVMAWVPGARLVASEQAMDLSVGGVSSGTLHFAKGSTMHLDGVLPRNRPIRSVRVEDDGGQALPLVTYERAFPRLHAPTFVPKGQVDLGPYPMPGAIAVVTLWDGEVHRVRLAR